MNYDCLVKVCGDCVSTIRGKLVSNQILITINSPMNNDCLVKGVLKEVTSE